jgi:hypothetical protein
MTPFYETGAGGRRYHCRRLQPDCSRAGAASGGLLSLSSPPAATRAKGDPCVARSGTGVAEAVSAMNAVARGGGSVCGLATCKSPADSDRRPLRRIAHQT